MSVESMFIIAAVVILLLIGMGIAGYLLIKKTNAERNNMEYNNMGNYGNPYNFKYLKN
jgi:flagellar basal body-associated protein FliL